MYRKAICFRKHSLYWFVVLCFCCTNIQSALSNTNSPNPFGLVISGGVSLGVYEAGLNWAYIEALRLENSRTNGTKFKLDSVTGTSAGSINSILSALRYCESEFRPSNYSSNLFFETWDVGLTDLLPPNQDSYDNLKLGVTRWWDTETLNDSLFARSAFQKTVDKITELSKLPIYKPDCEVKIALIVTHSKPQVTEIEQGREQSSSFEKPDVIVQRFVIPIKISTYQKKGEINARVKFSNYLGFTNVSGLNNRHIYLPEYQGSVSVDAVIRAALASSAFPLAFGRVRLSYCTYFEKGTTTYRSNDCPAQHRLNTGYFIDGGVFDNVPLRAAVDLVEGDTQLNVRKNYIFIDPDNVTTDYGFNPSSVENELDENKSNSQLFELISLKTDRSRYVVRQKIKLTAVLKANVTKSDLIARIEVRRQNSLKTTPEFTEDIRIKAGNQDLISFSKGFILGPDAAIGTYNVDIAVLDKTGTSVWSSKNARTFEITDNGKLTLAEQINSVLPAITTLRAQDLNSVLDEKFYGETNESIRKLWISRRSNPITGYFMANFGAFLDPAFRRYDYSVGIYDGLANVAKFLCDREYSGEEYSARRCSKGEKALIAELAKEILNIKDGNDACIEGNFEGQVNMCNAITYLLRKNNSDNHSSNSTNKKYSNGRYDSKSFYLIGRIFDENPSISFDEFLKTMRSRLALVAEEKDLSKENPFGAIITDIVQRENPDWKNDIMVAFASRLFELEKISQGKAQKQLAALWVMTPYTNVGGKLTKNYSPYKQRYSAIDRVMPHFVGVDGAQTGTVLSWHTRRLPVGFITDKSGVNINFFSTMNFQFDEEDRTRKGSTSIGTAFNSERPESFLFSSYGVNTFASFDKIGLSDTLSNANPGVEVYFGFLGDKFRISLGNRNLEHPRGNWMVRVGISELHRFLPLIDLSKFSR